MAKKGASRGIWAVLLTAALTVALGLACFGAVLALAGPRAEQASAALRRTEAPDVVTLRKTPEPTPAPTAEPASTPAPEVVSTPTPEPTPEPDRAITIRVVGDIMCHDRQLAGALQADGGYSMEDWFDPIRESLGGADLTIGNLETCFAGEEAGFDVLTTANNHTYDFRAAGIERTLRVLDERGLAHTGAYAQQSDYDELLICDVGGVRVGVLAYTATFNSKPKRDYCVRALSREQAIGVIFEIGITKDGGTGETRLERTGYVPTVVYRWREDHRDRYAVLPCGVYKEKDGHDKQRRCRKVWEWMEQEMGAGWEILEQ